MVCSLQIAYSSSINTITKELREKFLGIVVSFDNDRKKNSSDPLEGIVDRDLEEVNKLILRKMDSPVSLIPQLAGHIIAAGGKRLRPMLTLAAAQMCGYTSGQRHVALAACIEFIHTATLLHDDVVDESLLRRGQASANDIFGNKSSVLVGDFLFSRAFELMVEDGSLDVLRILSHASAVIAEGEIMQLTTTNDTETGETTYLEVIKDKTAHLFAAACRVGAVVASRPKVEEEALETFGMNLGIIFQLIDDVLDYSAEQMKLGKTVGDDFREGKITLPVILAFRRGDEQERAFWRRTLQNKTQNSGDFEHAIELMEQHNAITDTIKRTQHYGAIARDSLGIFKDCQIKHAFHEMIDYCIERVH